MGRRIEGQKLDIEDEWMTYPRLNGVTLGRRIPYFITSSVA
jgi:hypothetical protein